MSVDYGSRIRAVCDYLETVPGNKYNFWVGPSNAKHYNGCGCVVAHAYMGEVIPKPVSYYAGARWLGFCDEYQFQSVLGADACHKGEISKQAAIKSLRAYADKHYPDAKPKHVGLPDVVRDLFRIGAAA